MKHPTPEQWMDYLYEESSNDENEELARHLQACKECQSTLAAWRGARTRLDEWPMEAAPRRPRIVGKRIAWGLAAAITLFLGIGLGQLTARSADPARVARILEPQLRAEVKSVASGEARQSLQVMEDQLMFRVSRSIQGQLDQQVAEASNRTRQEVEQMVARVADSLNNLRETDKVALVGMLKQMETDELARLASMRKDLETVAIVGETKIDAAQREIGQLASVSQAIYHPNSDNP